VVDPSNFSEPSTKAAAEALSTFGEGRALVVLASEGEEACAKSFRNIAGVTVLPADQAGVADIVGAARLVASQGAIDQLTALAGGGES
jgi:large subunit ribosomal protein L4